MEMPVKIIIIFVLLLVSGFFSSSETAFFSLNRVRLRRRRTLKDPGFKYILHLLKTPSKFLTTVLIGNELVNISISVVTAALVYSVAHDLFDSRVLPFISMVVTVPVLLLFGEIIPKTIAVKYPEKTARINSFALYCFSHIITPVRFILNAGSKVFINLFVKDPSTQAVDTVNIDEDIFKSMVDTGRREGTIEPEERLLIHRAFRLDDIDVSKIMTPRERIVAVSLSSSTDDFLELVEEEKYSRYPVFDQDLDTIAGFIHAKDLLRLKSSGPEDSPLTIRSILRKPTFIPADRNALSAFLQLKNNKTHIGIVLDGQSNTAGIITMEDILEELFGEIRDETDMEADNDA